DSLYSGLVRGEPKQAIVGSDEAGADTSLDRNRRARGADSRIDNRKENRTRREVAPALAQSDRSGHDGLRRDAVSDVDHGCAGSDRRDDTLHRTGIMVAIAEVGYDCERERASRERRHHGIVNRETAALRNFPALRPIAHLTDQ